MPKDDRFADDRSLQIAKALQSGEFRMQAIRAAVDSAIREVFKDPIEVGDRRLKLLRVEIAAPLDPQDFSSQKEVKLQNKTWGVPVYGVFVLEGKDGKKLDEGRVKLLTLPQETARKTFIYNGKEYQFDVQFRLKPGIYTRVTDRGEFASRISAEGKYYRKTEIYFDPDSKTYRLSVGTSNVPLSTLLAALGVTQQEVAAVVGSEVAKANPPVAKFTDIKKLYKSLFGSVPDKGDPQAMLNEIKAAFSDSKLDPDATEHTTGERLGSVDKKAILTTMKRLLLLARGEVEEDDPNSLVTKNVQWVEDYIREWITKYGPDAKRKIANKLGRVSKVSDAINSSILMPALGKLYTSPLAQRREQYNILDVISGHARTTLRGPGGISDQNMIRDEMRVIHPSHIGFLDPVKTPEGENIGTTLYLAAGVHKYGNDLYAFFYDMKKGGKIRALTPKEVQSAIVGFPDEFDIKPGKKPVPKKKVVSASVRGNIEDVDASKVEFVPVDPRSIFSLATNLIPFLRNNNGVRAMTASRQIEQAISIQGREAPLVQVKASATADKTFEEVVGKAYGSAVSPVDGTVLRIKDGYILIKGKDGKNYKVPFYANFPLNNSKAGIDAIPRVSPGDKVKKGQILADSNFTKDGILALGTNLRVAYVPWRGLTFEDAVVISESAAKKLGSEHHYQLSFEVDKNTITGKKKFQAYYPNRYSSDQLALLDDDGVIRKGSKVEKGQPLFVALGKRKVDPDSEAVLRVSKDAVITYKDKSETWDKPFQGVVTEVVKRPSEIKVIVKTVEPAVEGDKIVGRHGNKGIIARVVPDEEMPRGEDGEPFEILMNPAGVIGRINLGQVFETVLGKVAKKTGKSVAIDNFKSDEDTYKLIDSLLKKYKVKDSERVLDPTTGETTDKPVLTGYQYVMKLTHQVDKKLSARGAVSTSEGERLPYTVDLSPAGGGKTGGQSIGRLDVYALLAHGAVENLQEMYTYKSDAQNAQFWTALKAGTLLPPPEVPFTAKKFLAMLEAMGVHVKKDGKKLQIMPLTDRDVERLSSGELKNPGDALDYKLRPYKGGIFDSTITGGLNGKKWSHINLPVPVLNPIAKDAVTRILDYLHPEYSNLLQKLLDGKLGVDDKGQIVSIDGAKYVGVEAVRELLRKAPPVDKMIADVERKLNTAPVSKVNIYNKLLKYLRALKELGYKPEDAYILTKIPVLPPAYRPLIVKEDGSMTMEGINGLYKALGETVMVMRDQKTKLPPKQAAERSKAMQDSVEALIISGYTSFGRQMKSILQTITGSSPKMGYFQRKVLRRRQDLSARSTIVPNADLDMDTIEVPEKALWELYSPFVVRRLRKAGYSMVDAHQHLKDKTKVAKEALMEEIKERPVLMKRDPVLHKFGIQAFYPKPSPGKTVRIPPSVTAGYNADFDGDTVALFVPATEMAKEEAKNLVPSKNVWNPQGGQLMHKPEHEAQLGLYLLTKPGKKTNFAFTSLDQALRAYKARQIKINDIFRYKGRETSLGRLLVASILPKGRIQEEWYRRIAFDKRFALTKKEVQAILEQTARVAPAEFPRIVQQLRRFGDKAAFSLGGSFTFKDFKPLSDLNKSLPSKMTTKTQVAKYDQVRAKVEELAKKRLEKEDNGLMQMIQSGARGNWDQMKQIVLSPGAVTNTDGSIAPKPINRSFSEGLTLSEYWTSMYGARRGMIAKVRGTSKPGYFSKQILTSVADVRITEEDCGTNQGISESIMDPDIIGRYLAKAQKIGKKSHPKDTLVDHDLIREARSTGVKQLYVRSPLKCEAHDGICAKCFGKWHDGNLPPVGTHIGIISGQSIGERGTQLSMKMFHEGGVKGKTTAVVDQFTKVRQILEAPQNLRDEAVLAKASGTVSKIVKEAAGWRVWVGTTDHFVPSTKELQVKVGQKVNKGEPLSSGTINVHKLVDLAGVSAAQREITNSLAKIYQPLGVNKRHMETVARYITSLGVVESANGTSAFARGDIVPLAKAEAFNKKFVPVDWAIGHKLAEKYLSYGKGTEVTEEVADDLKKHGINRIKIQDGGTVQVRPIIKGVGQLPKVRDNDWAYKMSFENLKDAVTSGALTAASADIEGKYPHVAVGFGQIGKNRPKVVV